MGRQGEGEKGRGERSGEERFRRAGSFPFLLLLISPSPHLPFSPSPLLPFSPSPLLSLCLSSSLPWFFHLLISGVAQVAVACYFIPVIAEVRSKAMKF